MAWLFGNNAALTHRIETGDIADITNALASETVYTVNHVSIAVVRRHLYANAADAGITLPQRLTVAEDEGGYAQWREEIAAYQERAGMRVAKTKPLTPA